MLIAKFRKQLKGSVFVFSLAFVDMSYCLLYFYNFPLKSLVFYLESDFMANVRHKAQHQIETVEEFGNFFIPILMMYIVIEKFLWTCTPRTRYSLRLFTVDRPKFILTAITAGIGIMVVVISTWNLVVFLNTIQRLVIPLTIALTVPISFIFALITLCRIGCVGKGENPVDQAAVNLGNEEENHVAGLTTSQVKKSILCMLTFYFLFFLRGVFYFAYVRQHTKGIFANDRHLRIRECSLWSKSIMNGFSVLLVLRLF
ncbi:Protein CBG04679 [Caenorhabditis briggsae]|uniref:Protein CBG04679 n=1 Tax=Caenorhabditis briggsae TaxID=6238 RepID=A8WY78_CAEBR|nr:Protein CBG04679 [Caenorhabditis briggsae]CAP25336.2 Protein CBG04679 [Caenorhabditis briggsae]